MFNPVVSGVAHRAPTDNGSKGNELLSCFAFFHLVPIMMFFGVFPCLGIFRNHRLLQFQVCTCTTGSECRGTKLRHGSSTLISEAFQYMLDILLTSSLRAVAPDQLPRYCFSSASQSVKRSSGRKEPKREQFSSTRQWVVAIGRTWIES